MMHLAHVGQALDLFMKSDEQLIAIINLYIYIVTNPKKKTAIKYEEGKWLEMING